MENELAFTVDVDPDLNSPVPGAFGCGSMCGGTKLVKEARFDSCINGLSLLLELFDDVGIEATLFFEGRTAGKLCEFEDIVRRCKRHEIGCHGFEHEDYASIGPYDEKARRVWASKDAIAEIFGKEPKGFRAPYLHADAELLGIVEKAGFVYDSSFAQWKANKGERAYVGSLVEFAVPYWKRENGKKIYSYLWPMHEGEKEPEQYLDALRMHFAAYPRPKCERAIALEHSFSGAIFPIRCVAVGGAPFPMLATHTWHVASSFAKGDRDHSSTMSEVEKVRKIIKCLQALGCRFVTLGEVAKMALARELEA